MAESKPETKSSGGWNLDGIAAKLQAKADELLKTSSTGSTEENGAPASGSKREALKNVANIVKDNAGKGLESSKEYLSKVVEQVSAYATDASTTANAKFADAKEKGLSHFSSASDAANDHYAKLKDTASTHLEGVKTNLNKAIAQGKSQAQASSTSETTENESETTDRALPTEEEPLSFPFNVIAWLVALCHGKNTSTATATTTSEPASESATSTSKDFSVESLQNAAATLTAALSQEVRSAGEKAHAAGEKAVTAASEKPEDAKSSESDSGKIHYPVIQE